MSLFDSIERLIQMCQFFGLAPFSMNKKTSKWEPNSGLQMLSIFVIIYIGIILIVVIVFNDNFINYNNSKIHIVLHSMFLVLSQTHALFALVELFIKRKQSVQLLNTIENLDILLKKHLNMNINYGRLKTTCRRFFILWMCEIVGVVISGTFIYIETKNPFTPRYFLMFVPAYALCKMSYVYSMILVALIDESLDVLNIYVKSITKKNGYYLREIVSNQHELKRKRINYFNENRTEFSPKALLFLRSAYSKMWSASVQVRNITYWSLPFGITNEFYVLTFNSFLLSMNFFRQAHVASMYVLTLIDIFSDLVNVLCIARICSKAADTVSQLR